ncbi:unnamed protein product [Vitrella brassicaformis CCMP3155]|uniref:Uncharacterized protein n=1 Tax=Vitrella brassicaformis (strain CCMP3155) TaxID=1169540 RepID=A0A0G4H290_VITBC|nr:unnamed protein product [Vitrella brassicaformis CCMP3155]|eukprot:CEM37779.1 unnamed protein product [Vitrella brassicaformis CCMP3155]
MDAKWQQSAFFLFGIVLPGCFLYAWRAFIFYKIGSSLKDIGNDATIVHQINGIRDFTHNDPRKTYQPPPRKEPTHVPRFLALGCIGALLICAKQFMRFPASKRKQIVERVWKSRRK